MIRALLLCRVAVWVGNLGVRLRAAQVRAIWPYDAEATSTRD